MPNRTSNIHLVRQRVIESSERGSATFIRSTLTESGDPNPARLHRQIDEILDGLSEKPSLAPQVEQAFSAVLDALHQGDVARTATHVCALLSLEMDDLRRAALLSLMVRLVGKRKFDPIASYILQNQKVLVTSRG
jgi:hypothetical protein